MMTCNGRRGSRRLLARSCVWAVLLAVAPSYIHAQTTAEPAVTTQARPTQGSTEIDLFMERVLDNRDASWRRLGDFILRETETFTFEAPLGIPLSGIRREYEWLASICAQVLPAGLVGLVQGGGEIGAALVESSVDAVVVTTGAGP